MTQSGRVAEVKQALRRIIDPELGENVVDLGLIYEIAVEEDIARIRMTTTTRGCPAAAFLEQAVRSAAEGVPGIRRAEVEVTHEPRWTPAMMSEAARLSLGRR